LELHVFFISNQKKFRKQAQILLSFGIAIYLFFSKTILFVYETAK